MFFSNSLIEDGYIILNDVNAKIYGDSFRYSSTSINELESKKDDINNTSGNTYKEIILNSTEDYSLTISDLIDYGFLTEFPDKFNDNNNNNNNKYY